ncbi:MAG: endonuclease/exonuclease/phosphatase family protein [Owenweeksia sp.]|nr:endonuclease/exonuclease/phosphatase family protein [Owenweeksia sp.]
MHPEGARYWSNYRYREKSQRMAKAILALGEWEPPAVVGVAEIENRKVLDDLVQSPVLRKFDYGIIHYESPDRRGIDVALLFREKKFTPLYSQNVPVSMVDKPNFATRDILYVKGVIKKSDTLHLMVCHWPSRYGGQAISEPKRIRAAQVVRRVVDSIFDVDPVSRIIIMGDFNDEYTNISLRQYLRARLQLDMEQGAHLINLMAQLAPEKGSHRYRGEWSYLDQIIVSNSLLEEIGTEIIGQQAQVFRADFLLEPDEKYPGQKPFRSFIGMRYHGGFSDHLPVFIDLALNSD